MLDPWRNRIVESKSLPPKSLKKNPGNWRKHPQVQREQLEKIMAEVGVVRRVLVNKTTGHIVDGHLRVELALARGDESIEVDVVELSPEEEATVLASLDTLALIATPDRKALDQLLAKTSINLDALIGAAKAPIDALIRAAANQKSDGRVSPDDVPDAPTAPRAKAGDAWALGRHTLVCGDSRDPATWARCGAPGHCLWTDPPYGVDIQGGYRWQGEKRGGKRIRNDDAAGLPSLLAAVFAALDPSLAPGAPIYVASPPGSHVQMFWDAIEHQWGKPRQMLIWVKSMVLGHSDYHFAHEPVFYARKPGPGRAPWFGDRAQTSVFDVPRPARSAEHPTMKPVELIERMLANSTQPGERVIDPFGGSGSTLIACERLNRSCFMIEIDPVYADVIVDRWEKFTGEKAQLLPK